MSEQEIKRIAVNVPLVPDARRIIESLREDTGVPVTEAMTRILEWFTSLQRPLRLAVLTRDVESRNTFLLEAMRLELAASGIAVPVEFEQMVGAMRKMLDDMASMHRTAVKFARSVNEPESKKRK